MSKTDDLINKLSNDSEEFKDAYESAERYSDLNDTESMIKESYRDGYLDALNVVYNNLSVDPVDYRESVLQSTEPLDKMSDIYAMIKLYGEDWIDRHIDELIDDTSD